MILHPLPLAEILKKIPLIYLATPYTKYLGGIDLAHIDASKLAANLLQAGVKIICPIAHTHPIAKYGNIDPLDHYFWMRADVPLMEKSDALLIGKFHRWDSSDGIIEETKYFQDAHKSIFLIDPYTMQLERDCYEFRSKKKHSDLYDQRARPL